MNILRHLLRSARGGAAGVVLVFGAFFAMALSSGALLAIPGLLIVTSWFFKYAYVLFDHSVRGFDDPPVLDINMLNPLNEQRPLAQLAIICLLIAATYYSQVHVGHWAAIAIVGVSLLFLPASVAILGLEGHMLKAANPVAWVRMAWGLGPLYPLILVYLLVDYRLVAWLGQIEIWLFVRVIIALFGVLSVFSLLGGALYERRDALGLEVWKAPEHKVERQQKQNLRDSEKLVTEAYGLMRVGSHVKCWDMLQSWLTAQPYELHGYHWLCQHVESWDDPRYITRLSEDYVARLLALKRTGEALDIVRLRLEIDPGFRPKTAADTFTIAQLAARGGGAPWVARLLLSDFAARFPGDSRGPAAATLAQHLDPRRTA